MSTDRRCEGCERRGGEVGLREAVLGAASDGAAGGAEAPGETLVAGLRGRATCSVDEAALALGIGRSTAYAGVRDGSLPSLRISNRILIPTAKLLALLGLEEAA